MYWVIYKKIMFVNYKNPTRFLLILSLCLGFCTPKSDKKEDANKNAGLICLNAKQMANMSINLGLINEKVMYPNIEATGIIVSKPNFEAYVTSNISGRIEKFYVFEGSEIKKGQAIAQISSIELIEMQQNYMSAYNDIVFNQKEYERQNELRKSDVGSLADFQMIESKYYTALSLEKALKAKLDLLHVNTEQLHDPKTAKISLYKDIYSPIDGYVLKLPLSVGMRADLGVSIAHIADPKEMMADIFLYEKDLNLISENQELEIEFINESIPKTKGKINYIDRSLDQSSKAVTLQCAFNAPKGHLVLPKMSVKAYIKGNTNGKPVQYIPATALFEEDGHHYFYLLRKTENENYYFERINAGTIITEKDWVGVNPPTPVKTNSSVVVSNTLILEAEYKKGKN